MSSPTALVDSINSNSAYTTPLATTVYAFNASGGFTIERGFDDIDFREQADIHRFDVTDAVQIVVDVAAFNAKLGFETDGFGSTYTTSFNPVTDCFEISGNEVSSITFSSSEFFTWISNSYRVVSNGKLSTLYTDFEKYVKSYFGFEGGFSSLFAGASDFTAHDIWQNSGPVTNVINDLVRVRVDNNTGINPDLSGSITINNITKLLRYAVDTNCFGNRMVDPSGNMTYNNSSYTPNNSLDPSSNANYGVADGFVEGDLIWIPSGITATLKVGIDSESFQPINNVGPSFTSNYSQTTNYNASGSNFSQTSSATTNAITRTVKAPMLIRLVNSYTLNDIDQDQYGQF